MCGVVFPHTLQIGVQDWRIHGLKYTYGAGYLLKNYNSAGAIQISFNSGSASSGDSESRPATDKHLKDNYQSNLWAIGGHLTISSARSTNHTGKLLLCAFFHFTYSLEIRAMLWHWQGASSKVKDKETHFNPL